MGLPVMARDDLLRVKRNVESLKALSKGAKLSDTEENGLQGAITDIKPLDVPISTKSSAYQTSTKTKRSPVFYAKEVMSSPPLTLYDDMPLDIAWQQFRQHRFRHFPVVNKENKIVGILSDRDMLINSTLHANQDSNLSSKSVINQIMIKSVITASVSTNIREICQVMFSQHIGAMPITNDKGDLLGIITRSDILRTMIKNEPFELWV